jgi:trimethylamine--corrinoid protein Co-methyltransferase
MSYEKFVLDLDNAGAMHVMLQGLALDKNGFAMDAFREVSPGNHFFGCAHTLANYRTAFFESDTADNNSFEQWHDDGELDALQRANLRWKDMLARYQPPAMDPATDEELRAFIAKKKEDLPDVWH